MLKTLNRIWKNATHNKLRLEHRTYTIAGKCLINSGIQSSISFSKSNFPKRYINKVADQKNSKRSENIAKKYREMEANLKWRTDPVITTLDTPQFKSILRKNILDLVALFQKNGYEIRIAGGAVRLGFHSMHGHLIIVYISFSNNSIFTSPSSSSCFSSFFFFISLRFVLTETCL